MYKSSSVFKRPPSGKVRIRAMARVKVKVRVESAMESKKKCSDVNPCFLSFTSPASNTHPARARSRSRVRVGVRVRVRIRIGVMVRVKDINDGT